jgi:hypothetical protein
MAVRFVFGVLSAAALAIGLLVGSSLGAYFAGAGDEAAARPGARRISTPVNNPAALMPPPSPTPISSRG